MTANRAQRAPRHLTPAARRWWRSAVETFALEDHHLLLLQAACELWDRKELARQMIAKDGLVFVDRHGATREHPAVKIAKDCAIAFARVVRELRFDVGAPSADERPPRLVDLNRGRA
jgi:phage terminase small subunit